MRTRVGQKDLTGAVKFSIAYVVTIATEITGVGYVEPSLHERMGESTSGQLGYLRESHAERSRYPMSFVRKDRGVVTGQNGDLIPAHLGDQDVPTGACRSCFSAMPFVRERQSHESSDQAQTTWHSEGSP